MRAIEITRKKHTNLKIGHITIIIAIHTCAIIAHTNARKRQNSEVRLYVHTPVVCKEQKGKKREIETYSFAM